MSGHNSPFWLEAKSIGRLITTNRLLRVLAVISLTLVVQLGCIENGLRYHLREDPHKTQVLKLVGAQPNDAVVDLGCGGGFWSYELARAVGSDGQVYALDILEDLVRHVAKKAKARGLHQIKAVQSKPDDTTLPEESVDIIFFANTIHEVKKLPAFTEHLYGILKQGGRYVVIDDTRRLFHSSNPVKIRRITTQAGFKAGEIKKFQGTNRYLIVFTK